MVVTSWANVASQPPKKPVPKEKTISGNHMQVRFPPKENSSIKVRNSVWLKVVFCPSTLRLIRQRKLLHSRKMEQQGRKNGRKRRRRLKVKMQKLSQKTQLFIRSLQNLR